MAVRLGLDLGHVAKLFLCILNYIFYLSNLTELKPLTYLSIYK